MPRKFASVPYFDFLVVIIVSKIEISKAIHNRTLARSSLALVVIIVSKIEISKAIHNCSGVLTVNVVVVIIVSKIEISKAIHNSTCSRSSLSSFW